MKKLFISVLILCLYDLKTNKVILSDGWVRIGPSLTRENVADLLEKLLV